MKAELNKNLHNTNKASRSLGLSMKMWSLSSHMQQITFIGANVSTKIRSLHRSTLLAISFSRQETAPVPQAAKHRAALALDKWFLTQTRLEFQEHETGDLLSDKTDILAFGNCRVRCAILDGLTFNKAKSKWRSFSGAPKNKSAFRHQNRPCNY